MFECGICKSEFTTKLGLQYHIQHKACKLVKKINCPKCGKSFTLKSNMSQHMKTRCKNKNDNKINNDQDNGNKENIINNKEKIYEKLLELQNEIETLKEKSNKLEKENIELKKDIENNKKCNINLTNNSNNGIINNGTLHISLVGYGKENMKKIDEKEIINVFKNGFHSTLKLTDTLHFNPKYPENHNVYISNMKNKYAMIYDGEDWKLVTKDELIDRIYDDKKNYIEENFDKFIDSLTVSQKNALKRWLDTEDNDKIKRIKEQIKLLLYNKRNIPINNKIIKNLDVDIKIDNIKADKNDDIKIGENFKM